MMWIGKRLRTLENFFDLKYEKDGYLLKIKWRSTLSPNLIIIRKTLIT